MRTESAHAWILPAPPHMIMPRLSGKWRFFYPKGIQPQPVNTTCRLWFCAKLVGITNRFFTRHWIPIWFTVQSSNQSEQHTILPRVQIQIWTTECLPDCCAFLFFLFFFFAFYQPRYRNVIPPFLDLNPNQSRRNLPSPSSPWTGGTGPEWICEKSKQQNTVKVIMGAGTPIYSPTHSSM